MKQECATQTSTDAGLHPHPCLLDLSWSSGNRTRYEAGTSADAHAFVSQRCPLEDVQGLGRRDRKFRARSRVHRTRHLSSHGLRCNVPCEGQGARAQAGATATVQRGKGQKGPTSQGKDNAKGKPTKDRKLGPCHWRARDGHAESNSSVSKADGEDYRKLQKIIVQSNPSASYKQVRVDDKVLGHQQNNVTQRSGYSLGSLEVHHDDSGVEEEYPLHSVLDLTGHNDMLKDLYFDDDCIFALEMTKPRVELDALSELRKAILDFGAVLHRAT